MWLLHKLISACATMSFLGGAQGYLIDPESCAGDYTFVKDMVEQAFSMANTAVASVNTLPIDHDASFLLDRLFNLQGHDAKQLVDRVFALGPANNKGERTGILAFQDEKTGSIESLGKAVNEVVIFCNRKRIRSRKRDPLHLFDTKAVAAVDFLDPCLGAFMYTQRFEDHWDLIQICPWFLEYAKAKKHKTTKDVSSWRAKLAIRGLDKVITSKLYTPIDLLSLWDKCMLHEMMHTKSGGSKEDQGGFSGYGWKNCRALSTDPDCVYNADSLALFGSALHWAKKGSPIDENGQFVSGPPEMGSKLKGISWTGGEEQRTQLL